MQSRRYTLAGSNNIGLDSAIGMRCTFWHRSSATETRDISYYIPRLIKILSFVICPFVSVYISSSCQSMDPRATILTNRAFGCSFNKFLTKTLLFMPFPKMARCPTICLSRIPRIELPATGYTQTDIAIVGSIVFCNDQKIRFAIEWVVLFCDNQSERILPIGVNRLIRSTIHTVAGQIPWSIY